tara:strand:+ start:239252 stop:240046 length:795 start_codon:yes stop_codon:yes gene_type:complete
MLSCVHGQRLSRRCEQALIGLLVVVVSGCGDETQQIQPNAISEASTVSATTGPASSRHQPASATDIVTDVSIAAQKHSIDRDRTKKNDFDAPLSADASFFAAPKIESTTKQVVTIDQGHDPVRLIGFVGDESTDAGRKAILKIGEKMVTVRQGESLDGIDFVNIQGRSITMQRDRDRWTLSLFDQPLVNKPQLRPLGPVLSRRSSRRKPSTPRNWSPSRSGSQGFHAKPPNELPPIDEPVIELPEPPEPPDLSDLPGMEDLPGF